RVGRNLLHARLALPGRVARAAGARGLPGHRLLRLVRQAAVPWRRGHRLGRPEAALALEQPDRVAHGDAPPPRDAGQHAALVVELRAQTLAQVVHPLARVADHRDLEHGLSNADALADRPLLDVRASDGQVLADVARLDADRVEVLERGEQHLAERRVRVRAGLPSLPRAPA